MDEKYINPHLMEEYKLAISLINRLGNNVVTIKGWCITIVAGMIALTKSVESLSFELTVVLSGIIVVFFFIEVTYRRVMERFKQRCRKIENFINREEKEPSIKSPYLMNYLENKTRGENIPNSWKLERVFPLYLFLIIGVFILHFATQN